MLTFSFPVLGGIITGIAALFGSVIAWIWQVKQQEVSHWKDRYTEQRRDNEDIRAAKDNEIEKRNEQIDDLMANPKEAAMRVIAASNEVMFEKIKKLQAGSILLEEKLIQKD
jgi:hypothetical protein